MRNLTIDLHYSAAKIARQSQADELGSVVYQIREGDTRFYLLDILICFKSLSRTEKPGYNGGVGQRFARATFHISISGINFD